MYSYHRAINYFNNRDPPTQHHRWSPASVASVLGTKPGTKIAFATNSLSLDDVGNLALGWRARAVLAWACFDAQGSRKAVGQQMLRNHPSASSYGLLRRIQRLLPLLDHVSVHLP